MLKSDVQSIIFNKNYWNLNGSINWLKQHGYKYEVDEKEHFYRFRQHNPYIFKRFITKDLHNGIELIIGYY